MPPECADLHLPWPWPLALTFALPLRLLPACQVRNLLEPRSLEGLSVGTMLLALLGNALMVPRALLVRDVVWLSGTTWACTAGWGQLFSMFKSVSASTGWVAWGPRGRRGGQGVSWAETEQLVRPL